MKLIIRNFKNYYGYGIGKALVLTKFDFGVVDIVICNDAQFLKTDSYISLLEGWGAKVIDRMSKDLKIAFPEMSGFSPRNIKYMRKFAQCWLDEKIVQRVVAQIPWRTNITLMDKLKTQEERIWYAGKTIENGWSKTILELQIQSRLMERTGKTVNNFPAALPPLDSDMANQIFKFDFFGTDMPRREVEIEQKLIEHIQSFLLELGQGFAFVGRQVHLEVGG